MTGEWAVDNIFVELSARRRCIVRINSDLPIQNTNIQNTQRNGAEGARSNDEVKDVVSINGGPLRSVEMDRGIRDSQDAMTLFRIADDSLAKIEDSLMKMGELAQNAANGRFCESEIELAQFEMDDLVERVGFAADSATMRGVPVFGDVSDTGAMWISTWQNLNALSPKPDNDMVLSLPATGVGALGLSGVSVATRASAAEAGNRISGAIAKVTIERTVTTSQINRMGAVASELAINSMKSFSQGTRITDTDAAAGLMAFVGRALSDSPEAAFAAQSNLLSDEVAKLVG